MRLPWPAWTLAAAVFTAPATATAAASAAAPASASAPAPAAAPAPRARYEQAEQDFRALRFAEALQGYRDALAAAPSASFARAARSRADWLAARAEGDFAPLRRVEPLRRDPGAIADRAAAEALERDLDAFPPGRVRVEGCTLLAAAWRRLGDTERAAASLQRVLDDDAADPVTRAFALRDVVELLRERGDISAARAAVLRHPGVAPELAAEVLRVARRSTLRWVAVAALGAIAAAAAAGLWRARRRAGEVLRSAAHPLVVGGALYVGAGGAILTRLHGGADPRPFVWLGLGALGVAVAGRALRLSAPGLGRAARAGWAFACALGVLAAAYLALERTNAGYLESFGL